MIHAKSKLLSRSWWFNRKALLEIRGKVPRRGQRIPRSFLELCVCLDACKQPQSVCILCEECVCWFYLWGCSGTWKIPRLSCSFEDNWQQHGVRQNRTSQSENRGCYLQREDKQREHDDLNPPCAASAPVSAWTAHGLMDLVQEPRCPPHHCHVEAQTLCKIFAVKTRRGNQIGSNHPLEPVSTLRHVSVGHAVPMECRKPCQDCWCKLVPATRQPLSG